MESAILETYQGIRSRRPSYPAAKALSEARERAPDPKRRLYGKRSGAGLGAPMDDGGQWAERPADLGLRFFGWADEMGGRYDRSPVEHKGWYLDRESQDEVARACVYLLPARDGRARYVPAFRVGSDHRGTWSDQSGGDSAVVYLDSVELGAKGGAEYPLEDEARDAARYADGRAERYAEAESDYQEAWRVGNQYREAVDMARTLRAERLGILADLRDSAVPLESAIAAAVEARLADLRELEAEQREEARKLASDRPRHDETLATAWREAASMSESDYAKL